MVRFAIMTASDMCSRGEREDKSGDAIAEIMTSFGHSLMERAVMSDDRSSISERLMLWCDEDKADLILTTGGTGLGPRDVTPDATCDVISYEVEGVAEAMRAYSIPKRPMAMLSRAKAGVRKHTLIINLPGSPSGVREMLTIVLPVINHAVEILRGLHSGAHPDGTER